MWSISVFTFILYDSSELNALKEEIINNDYSLDYCQEKNDNNNENTNNNVLKPIRRRTNRSFPPNRSKFLNEKQRNQVLQFDKIWYDSNQI